MSDKESEQDIQEPSRPQQPRKPKRPITEKQKAARAANLAKGRAARLKKVAEKKAKVESEYDLSSETEDSSSDSDDSYVLKKKKKEKPQPKKVEPDNDLRKELQELREIVQLVAKKQKHKPRERSSTKLVLLPQQPSDKRSSPQVEQTADQILRLLGHRK